MRDALIKLMGRFSFSVFSRSGNTFPDTLTIFHTLIIFFRFSRTALFYWVRRSGWLPETGSARVGARLTGSQEVTSSSLVRSTNPSSCEESVGPVFTGFLRVIPCLFSENRTQRKSHSTLFQVTPGNTPKN